MKIALCLLVKNEVECMRVTLPKIVEAYKASGLNSIHAIDGGSTDGSVELLNSYQIPVLAQSSKGRGQAFHHAFQQIDADAYVFFSPDGNEDENDLSKFKTYLENGNDLVIASRMCKGAVNEEDGQLFKWRKWANNAFNILANIFFRKDGPFITDSINGYRGITRGAAQTLALSAQDYTIEYQMTIRALKKQLKIFEFPTLEGPRIAGETGAPSFQTGVKFIKRLWNEIRGRD